MGCGASKFSRTKEINGKKWEKNNKKKERNKRNKRKKEKTKRQKNKQLKKDMDMDMDMDMARTCSGHARTWPAIPFLRTCHFRIGQD